MVATIGDHRRAGNVTVNLSSGEGRDQFLYRVAQHFHVDISGVAHAARHERIVPLRGMSG
jgi:hypothetical protein